MSMRRWLCTLSREFEVNALDEEGASDAAFELLEGAGEDGQEIIVNLYIEEIPWTGPTIVIH